MSNVTGGYPTNKKKLHNYYHQFTYENIDYDAAFAYYLDHGDLPVMACSVFRVGRYVCRNLDLPYSEDVEFLIRTPKSAESYAVNGHAGGFHELSKSFVESGEESELYKILPFQLHDGINETGLFACYNLVPTDYGQNVAEPTSTQEVEICGLMLVRYLLDKFNNAYDAAKYVQEHCRVYFTTGLHTANYELHLMLADEHTTYILEFIDNKTEIINVTATPYMTNFYRYGVTLNADGTVFTPETQTDEDDAITTNGITEYGSGLERFNLIVESLRTGYKTPSDCMRILQALRLTRAYPSSPNHAEPQWYTEFVGNGLKVNSPVEDYEDILASASTAFTERTRSNPVTWQTAHSVLYDLFEHGMAVNPQESGETITPYMIPYQPASRLEQYLGTIMGLYGYEKPSVPSSRAEQYLEHMIENGTKYGLNATVVGTTLYLTSPVSDVVDDLNTEV